MRSMLIRRRWQCNTIGNVLRKPTDNITRIALRWTPEGERKPGRPKNTRRRTVEKEMKEHNKALYHPFIAIYQTNKKIPVSAS